MRKKPLKSEHSRHSARVGRSVTRSVGNSPRQIVDACSGALEMLNPEMKARGLFEYYRQQAEEVEAKRKTAWKPVERIYAPGSLEYAAQQKALRGGGSR